eukprot:6725234-Ditylum_brightwellii.AAC.1
MSGQEITRKLKFLFDHSTEANSSAEAHFKYGVKELWRYAGMKKEKSPSYARDQCKPAQSRLYRQAHLGHHCAI